MIWACLPSELQARFPQGIVVRVTVYRDRWTVWLTTGTRYTLVQRDGRWTTVNKRRHKLC